MSILKLANTTTFEDVEKMIYKISHGFAQRYNLEFTEVLSHASELYMKALDDFNPKRKVLFSTFLYFYLSRKLITVLNKEKKISSGEELNEEIFEPVNINFNFLTHLRDELSEDGEEILELILNPNEELLTMLKWEGANHYVRYLKVLKEYLKCQDWDLPRIADGIREIRWALKSLDHR